MTKEFLQPEDKRRLKELYVGYHSPWNEKHAQAMFREEIRKIWDGYYNRG